MNEGDGRQTHCWHVTLLQRVAAGSRDAREENSERALGDPVCCHVAILGQVRQCDDMGTSSRWLHRAASGTAHMVQLRHVSWFDTDATMARVLRNEALKRKPNENFWCSSRYQSRKSHAAVLKRWKQRGTKSWVCVWSVCLISQHLKLGTLAPKRSSDYGA